MNSGLCMKQLDIFYNYDIIYNIKCIFQRRVRVKEKINSILNIIMISFIGQFIGSGLYKYWHFRKYPNLYAMQSAPWYLSIFVY